jgi:hypothetical protein
MPAKVAQSCHSLPNAYGASSRQMLSPISLCNRIDALEVKIDASAVCGLILDG